MSGTNDTRSMPVPVEAMAAKLVGHFDGRLEHEVAGLSARAVLLQADRETMVVWWPRSVAVLAHPAASSEAVIYGLLVKPVWLVFAELDDSLPLFSRRGDDAPVNYKDAGFVLFEDQPTAGELAEIAEAENTIRT